MKSNTLHLWHEETQTNNKWQLKKKLNAKTLTDFLFSFFSLTVALFRREWQVAYRAEMSTERSQQLHNCTQHSHSAYRHNEGADNTTTAFLTADLPTVSFISGIKKHQLMLSKQNVKQRLQRYYSGEGRVSFQPKQTKYEYIKSVKILAEMKDQNRCQ